MRQPLACEGGTSLEFVTGGMAAAPDRARDTASDKDEVILAAWEPRTST
jgi:hypothetical protein